MKVYIIAQSLKKEFQGFKTTGDLASCGAGMYFIDESSARNYLLNVVKRRKQEIRLGIRNDDNLNPDTCLDFAICPAELSVDKTKMIKKGWTLGENL